MNASQISQVIDAFRTLLVLHMPFYAELLMHFSIERDDSVGTACTDGQSIRWSERFFSTLSAPQIRYVLMHELFHIVLMHPARAAGKDPAAWNAAADLIVNDLCDRAGAELAKESDELTLERPGDGIFSQSPVLTHQTADDLYAVILGDQTEGRTSGNMVLLRRTYEYDLHTNVIKSYGGRYYRGNTPSSVPNSTTVPVPPDLLAAAGEEGLEGLEAQMRALLQVASTRSRGMGLSSEVERRLMLALKKKPLNWKKLLRDYLSEALSDDASYATPERKYIHMDLILPGHTLDETGELEQVWAFIDSSGSIGNEDMNRFITELYHISKQFHCEMNLCYWDTSVTDVYKKLRSEQDVLKALPRHSGGTDIRCVYRWVQQNRIRPYVALILTDGYFGTPPEGFEKILVPRHTLLVLCNDSKNPVYEKIGRICRLAE